jgi:pteridine reductase
LKIDTELKGKVALVTGGARRVGRVIAWNLAEAGMDVCITYNESHADADKTVNELKSFGNRTHAVQVDMREDDAIDRIEREVTSHFGRLDALVNNASCFEPSPVASVSQSEFEENMVVNAIAPLMLIQRFSQLLGAHYDPERPDSPGRIINFIDTHILGEPLSGYVAYNSSKAALAEITATCAVELAPRITVNAIAPGVIDWADWYSAADKSRYLQRVPLARSGRPEDAATAVLFLVRDASYCTGQIIKLDGGRSLS